MNLLCALAQSSHPWEGVAAIILAIGGGIAVFSAVLVVTIRGYWGKYVAPLIVEESTKWYSDPKQIAAREAEREAWLKRWYEQQPQIQQREREQIVTLRNWNDNKEQRDARAMELMNHLRSPAAVTEQEQVIRRQIDNEIKRSDGLISREIHTQVSDMESRLMNKLEEVSQFLKEDTASKQQMIQRMAKLEGAIHALIPFRSSESSANIPAQTKPR